MMMMIMMMTGQEGESVSAKRVGRTRKGRSHRRDAKAQITLDQFPRDVVSCWQLTRNLLVDNSRARRY